MLTFSTAQEDELEQVAAFLRDRFGVSPTHRSFRTDVLRWKCFTAHPLWEGSRSYVYRRDGRIVAHGCVAPVNWSTAAGMIRTACVLDWAADPSVPGIGMLLFRSVAEALDGLMAIGGSPDALRVLPRAGFKVIQQMAFMSRVVRPARHHLATDRPKDWKMPARLARDVMRMTRSLPKVPAGWSAERVSQLDASITPALPAPGRPGPAVADRSVELLNYCLACPAAAMEAYRVRGPASAVGYFVLSKIFPECRICDLGVSTPARDDWRALLALAIAAAKHDEKITHIRTGITSSLVRELFQASGFQSEPSQPVLYWDRAKKGVQEGEVAMTLLENDFFYL